MKAPVDVEVTSSGVAVRPGCRLINEFNVKRKNLKKVHTQYVNFFGLKKIFLKSLLLPLVSLSENNRHKIVETFASCSY